jgi:hypothetical protein
MNVILFYVGCDCRLRCLKQKQNCHGQTLMHSLELRLHTVTFRLSDTTELTCSISEMVYSVVFTCMYIHWETIDSITGVFHRRCFNREAGYMLQHLSDIENVFILHLIGGTIFRMMEYTAKYLGLRDAVKRYILDVYMIQLAIRSYNSLLYCHFLPLIVT